MLIGIIRETKTPPDSRVLLTPHQCKFIESNFKDVKIYVQPSPSRSYKDEEYIEEGIEMKEDLSDCDVLFGVKEQKIDFIIPNKTYFFFSHTAKQQEYNKPLLKAIIAKKVQIVDYEYLVNDNGQRVIAFGKWAGIVGAHNAILTWGKRTKRFDLKPMNQCKDMAEAKSYYGGLNLGNVKIVLTGTGRVANGSAHILDSMGIEKVSSKDFLTKQFNESVYCQLEVDEMFQKETGGFDTEFFNNPKAYVSIFEEYTKVADIMINGIYWDKRAPAFFSKEDTRKTDFNIKVIADITCDIAPEASIPCTLRASTIAEPNFGFDPKTAKETTAFSSNDIIDMMTIDNLPNELPRDASEDFGKQFISQVLDQLLENGDMIYKASITTKEGKLNKPFEYLADYIK